MQVLLNFLSNAVKFAYSCKQIKVRLVLLELIDQDDLIINDMNQINNKNQNFFIEKIAKIRIDIIN